MAAHEFALAGTADEVLAFQSRYRPRWAFYVAALLGPIGLFALLRRKWIFATVSAAAGDDGGSAIVVAGTIPLRLHRALRTFFASS